MMDNESKDKMKLLFAILGFLSGVVALVLILCSVLSYEIHGNGTRAASVVIAVFLMFVADDWIGRIGQ